MLRFNVEKKPWAQKVHQMRFKTAKWRDGLPLVAKYNPISQMHHDAIRILMDTIQWIVFIRYQVGITDNQFLFFFWLTFLLVDDVDQYC